MVPETAFELIKTVPSGFRAFRHVESESQKPRHTSVPFSRRAGLNPAMPPASSQTLPDNDDDRLSNP